MGNRKEFFNLMLEASSYTLLKFSKDEKMLGAVPGIISVLHTWGQQLSFHPHIHCIVSGGGLTKDGNFKIASKAKSGILFPVKAMKVVYRAFFMRRLNQEVRNGNITLTQEQLFNFAELKDELFKKEWIVYAKRPFGGPQQVIEYLGRYVNKVAISNQRIKKMDDDTVTFEYKDYSDASKTKLMSLTHQEFLRRFEQHILPFRFTKIRSYGLYANNKRKKRVAKIFEKQKWPPHPKPMKVPLEIRLLEAFCIDITKCPTCKTGTMKLMQIVMPIKKERNDALDDWSVIQKKILEEK